MATVVHRLGNHPTRRRHRRLQQELVDVAIDRLSRVEPDPLASDLASTTSARRPSMFRRDPGVTSLRQRMQHVPGPLLDVGLALMVAVAILIAIGVAPQPGRRPDALAYLLGLTIAGLVLVRRRWPVAVLVVSAAALQLYYVLDYAGIRPAVPLSVALATAWAAGHPRWSLAVAAWFGGAPLLFRTLIDPEPVRQVLDDTVPDVVLLAAVLVLGEAIRNRRELDLEREKSERPAPQRPAGFDRGQAQADRGGDRRRLPRRHRAVRRHRRLHQSQWADHPRTGGRGAQ
jgi:hypothetical protein